MSFPPKVRKWLYRAQCATTGATTLIGVGYGAAQHALPQWYGVSVAVLAAGWTYLGMTASSNTPTDSLSNMVADELHKRKDA